VFCAKGCGTSEEAVGNELLCAVGPIAELLVLPSLIEDVPDSEVEIEPADCTVGDWKIIELTEVVATKDVASVNVVARVEAESRIELF